MPIQRNKYIDEPLKDGLMEYGTYTIQRDSERKETGRTFSGIKSLWFVYRNVSEYDTGIYPGISSSEAIKIKTYYIPDVENGLKVKINDIIYDITGTNFDDDRKYRYWLLTRVKL